MILDLTIVWLTFLSVCSAQIYPFKKWDESALDPNSFRAFSNQRVFNSMLDKLLNSSRYDGRLRPNATTVDPAVVYIRLAITDVTDVNEKQFSFTADFIVEQTWLDPRLRFIGMIPVSNDTYIIVRDKWAEKIWMPDIYFQNGRKGFRQDLTRRNQEMRIYPNGTVLFSLRLTMTLRCDMYLAKYPLDTQQCYVNMSSFNYAERDLQFKWAGRKSVSIVGLSLPAFSIQSNYFLSNCAVHRLHGLYSCVSVKLLFKRLFPYHLMQTYLPTSLLVVASWMSFWIDPQAVPARVSLSVTLLLSTLTLANGIRGSLPPVSDIKAIDVWMFACIFFVFAALFEFSIMNHAHTKLKRGEKLCGGSSCCRKRPKSEPHTVIVPHGETISLSSDDSNKISRLGMRVVQSPPKPPAADQMPIIYDIDRISQFLFPTAFVLFNIIYWPMYST